MRGTAATWVFAVVIGAGCQQGPVDNGAATSSSSGGGAASSSGGTSSSANSTSAASTSTASSSSSSSSSATSASSSSSSAVASTSSSSSSSGSACSLPPRCAAWNVVDTCGVQQVCPGGCFAGACSTTACADECALGDTRNTETCVLWSMTGNATVTANPVTSMRDRALDYGAYLESHNMPEGGVCNALYTDTTFTTVAAFDGYGDSAIWTGSALAAEAWRHLSTGAPDAARRIADITATLHRAFAVTGAPGYLARYVKPSDSTVPVEFDCTNTLSFHCGVPWNGRNWDWRGTTSRDQYTGVLLGYLLAYDATPDPAVRATIRADVVEMARQLMTPRPAMPVHVNLNGTEWDQEMDLENVIPAPMEMRQGRVHIIINSGDYGESRLDGIREFMPDMGPALRQLPLLSWLPAVPRSGSAVMLTAIFSMALHMTRGVPGQETTHADLNAYFTSHADAWFAIADAWNNEARACGGAYYANHISLILAYAYARTETDPTRLARFRSGVLDRMRQVLGVHKNSYFEFLLEGVEANPSPSDVATAVDQLAQFQPGPRINAPRNHLADYAHDDQCTDLGNPTAAENAPVDVGHRVVDDFIWQRDPWRLYADGNPVEVFPGVDYLAAYWAGRHHGFIAEDRPGTCTRWQ